MKHLKIILVGMFIAGIAAPIPLAAQTSSDVGSCIVYGKGRDLKGDLVKCPDGPLQSGDPRLGSIKMPHTADRVATPRNSFEVGGTSVTISGSVRVDSTFSK